MPCEHYKDALIEAAATGASPQGELRAHLAACASCRAAFEQEQSLFTAIDFGLHVAANTEVPPSLLPRVRAALDEVAVAPRLRWVQPLVFASACVVFAFLTFLMARPRHVATDDQAKRIPVAPAVTPGTNTPGKISPTDTQTASVRFNQSHTVGNSAILHSAASSNPEVLVPPDEREAFARLVATMNERSEVGKALLSQRPEKKDALVSVDPLQIADLEIEPLEGTETEAQDGAGEKR